MDISIIVAMDECRGIGIKNALPWRLSKDMAFFKEKTISTVNPDKQNAVVMGRLTWESLPDSFRPLPNRYNIVATRQVGYETPDDVSLLFDLDRFEDVLQTIVTYQSIESVYIIGGAQLYTWAIQQPFCTTLYVTRVHATFECDAFFPEFDATYTRVESSEKIEEKGLSFSFETYKRR